MVSNLEGCDLLPGQISFYFNQLNVRAKQFSRLVLIKFTGTLLYFQITVYQTEN